METILSELWEIFLIIVILIKGLAEVVIVNSCEGNLRSVEVERIGITSDNNEYICGTTRDKIILTDINTKEDKEILDLSESCGGPIEFCEIHGDYLYYKLYHEERDEDGNIIEGYCYDLKSGETTELECIDDILWISNPYSQETIPIDTDEGTVYFHKEYGEDDYMISFDGKNYEIMEGIGGTSKYHYSAICARDFIYKNGKIYAVINCTTQIGNWLYSPGYPRTGYMHDDDIKEQLFIEVDPKTQSYSTIYKVKGGKTRIIGYDNDYVYLLKKNTILRQNISTKKSEQLMEYKADKKTNINIVWAGDTLVVKNHNDGTIIGVMEVE